MSTRYSKKIITKILVDEEAGESRKYQFNKLAAYEVNLWGMRLARAVVPSAGSVMDSFISGDDTGILETQTQTFASALFFFSENFQDDLYTNLVDAIMGSMMVDGKPVEDWSDHFDDYPEEFFEILVWAGRESFESFFMGSTIVVHLKKKIMEHLPALKDKLNGVLTSNEIDYNEELSSKQQETTPTS